MTTTARLLTLLFLTLPLGACAARPADVAGGQQAAEQDGGRAAAPAPAPVPAPVAAAAQPRTALPVQQPDAPAAQPSDERPRSRASAPAPAAAAASGNAANTAAAPAAPLTSTPVQETPAARTGPGTAPASSVPATVPATVPPATATGPVTMPGATPTGSLLQTLFALVAVLAVLAALAWFLKRYGPKAGGGTADLRIVGSLNLGGRERLLVVEVGSQWIVVGASPGRVNALATMPKQEGMAPTAALAAHGPAANSFADWLKQTIDKRK
jgi:flagellar biosynthetic protein FliO